MFENDPFNVPVPAKTFQNIIAALEVAEDNANDALRHLLSLGDSILAQGNPQRIAAFDLLVIMYREDIANVKKLLSELNSLRIQEITNVQ